jgi:hypothetical protein
MQAEAQTCLSECPESLVEDGSFDRARCDSLMLRVTEFRGVILMSGPELSVAPRAATVAPASDAHRRSIE